MSILRELFEDILDIGEYATVGFVKEVLLGEEEHVPTYEKNRKANAMISEAKRKYTDTSDRYNAKVSLVQEKLQEYDKLKSRIRNTSIKEFASLIESLSRADRASLNVLKRKYEKLITLNIPELKLDTKPHVPSFSFYRSELESPILLFRLPEAQRNYEYAEDCKQQVAIDCKKLEMKMVSLEAALARIQKFTHLVLLVHKNLELVNNLLKNSHRFKREDVENGYAYLLTLGTLFNTPLVNNGEVTQESQAVLEFFGKEFGTF